MVLLIEVPPALHRTFPIAGVYPYLSSREVYETKSIVGYLQTFPLRSNLSAMSSPSLNTDRKGVCVESLKRCCLFIAERMLNTSLQYTVSWSWWYFFTSFIYSCMSSVIRVCCIIPLSGRFLRGVLYKWLESLNDWHLSNRSQTAFHWEVWRHWRSCTQADFALACHATLPNICEKGTRDETLRTSA